MRTKSLLLATFAVLGLISCTREAAENEVLVSTSLETKALNTSEDADTGSILLYLESEPDAAFLAELQDMGATKVEPIFSMDKGRTDLKKKFGLDKWYEVTLSSSVNAEKFAVLAADLDEVELLQYNRIYARPENLMPLAYDENPVVDTKATNTVFNDKYYSDQWNYHNTGNQTFSKNAYAGGDINIESVWSNLTGGDPSIIVAVVDEGVKYTHPDLAANMWSDSDGNHGYNFVDNGEITWDLIDETTGKGDTGHGTHCAGVIAAVNNNGTGISSVAGGTGNNDGVKIMSCQIFSKDKGGSDSQIAKAVEYAADNGASIISCSFGYTAGKFTSDGTYAKGAPVEYAAVRYFESFSNNTVTDGNIAVFASGNESKNYATYPGALADIISVSAYAPDFLPAYYTNYGPGCNIVAPGGEYYHQNASGTVTGKSMILSTVPSEIEEFGSDYGYMQGTSMACPHVSGIVALGLSYAKKLGKTFTKDEFKDMLVSSANEFDSRLNTKKTLYYSSGATYKEFDLYPYQKNMGTGGIDTWTFLMKIEGIPTTIVSTGSNQYVDISPYFGTSSVNLTYLDVTVADGGKEALGLAEDPYVKYGRLYIHPTKIGSTKITIRAVGGGTAIGGEDSIGGMEVTQTLSVVSRSFKSTTQGWL